MHQYPALAVSKREAYIIYVHNYEVASSGVINRTQLRTLYYTITTVGRS